MSDEAPVSRGRFIALGALGCAIGVYVVCVVAPLRPQGGDTVPGRLGAAAFACSGAFDLREVDWLMAAASRGQLPYHTRKSPDGRLVSIFGYGPALWGSVAMLGMRAGDVVTDAVLQRRTRHAAAAAVALSAALLFIALAAVTTLLGATLGAATAALSFAGCATLGQGLWQQTSALPLLMGALAALAWAPRRPRLLPLVPLLAGLAVVMRPPLFGLALALGLAFIGQSRRVGSRSALLVGGALAVATALLLVATNLADFGTAFPSSQLDVLAIQTPDGSLLRLDPAELGTALAGLLVSPARGLLFFAPLVLLAMAIALSRGKGDANRMARWLALGVALQWIIAAVFPKWWGGAAFGPRLLAETVWVGAWIAFGGGAACSWIRLRRSLVVVCAAWTVLVGALGLSVYDARLWEDRREPDRHPAALWDFADSPLTALFREDLPSYQLRDAHPGPFRFCAPRSLEAHDSATQPLSPAR